MSVQTPAGQTLETNATWPALRSDRNWSTWSLLTVAITFAAATWAFPVGGVIALFLPLDLGLAALASGTIIATVLVAVAAAPVASKYGVDTVMSTRAQLGHNGAYLTLAFLVISAIGWNTVLAILLGRSGAELLVRIGVIGDGGVDTARIVLTVAALLSVLMLLRGGTAVIKATGWIVAGFVFVLGTWILVVLIGEVGWDKIANARPVDAYPSQATNYMIGLDIGLAPQLSFLPYLGALARLVPGMRRATWPLIVGLAVPMVYLASIGLLAGLAVPDSVGDPSVFLPEIASTSTAVVLLLFTLITNIGTILVGTYVAVVGIGSVPVADRKLSWTTISALVLLPVLILSVFWPDQVYADVGTYMLYLGVAFAPLAGIMIIDFHVMRRQRISLDAIFKRDDARAYNFVAGFNPAGMLAMAAGVGTYLYLLNPVELTVRAPFKIISAGIPSALIAAVVYAVVTVLLVKPRGWGGYGESPTRTRDDLTPRSVA